MGVTFGVGTVPPDFRIFLVLIVGTVLVLGLLVVFVVEVIDAAGFHPRACCNVRCSKSMPMFVLGAAVVIPRVGGLVIIGGFRAEIVTAAVLTAAPASVTLCVVVEREEGFGLCRLALFLLFFFFWSSSRMAANFWDVAVRGANDFW